MPLNGAGQKGLIEKYLPNKIWLKIIYWNFLVRLGGPTIGSCLINNIAKSAERHEICGIPFRTSGTLNSLGLYSTYIRSRWDPYCQIKFGNRNALKPFETAPFFHIRENQPYELSNICNNSLPADACYVHRKSEWW
jgi:hypothetical protein